MIDGSVGGGGGLGAHQYIHNTPADYKYVSLLVTALPALVITEWEMHITAQGPRLQNDLYCVEWDVKLYHTIPYHIVPYRTIPYCNIPYHTIDCFAIYIHTCEKFPPLL